MHVGTTFSSLHYDQSIWFVRAEKLFHWAILGIDWFSEVTVAVTKQL